jgi:putative phosphoribosyl transferase
MQIFKDRVDAGRRLAKELEHLRGRDLVVIGLPRGGVPVAAEVAEALHAPLDVIVVRKLGVPFQPELALGAISEGGIRVIDDRIAGWADLTDDELADVEAREHAELERRARLLRGVRPKLNLSGRTAVVVDDGIATGATVRAACKAARARGAAHIVLAVPVAPKGWRKRFADVADELVSIAAPARLVSVGQWYADFGQTPDELVISCLDRAERRMSMLQQTTDGMPRK